MHPVHPTTARAAAMTQRIKRRACFGARWTHDVPWRGGLLLATGIHYGMRWAVMPCAAGAGGYVKVGLDHPWCVADPGMIESVDADVHGGLTYVDHEGWVGFDTAHAGDFWRQQPPGTSTGVLPRRFRRLFRIIDQLAPWAREWTIPLVAAECRRLAGYAAEVRAIRRYRNPVDDQEALEREVQHEQSVSFIGSRS